MTTNNIINLNYCLLETTKMNKREEVQGGENGLLRRSISPLYVYLGVGRFS
jgi:hypothetical protein